MAILYNPQENIFHLQTDTASYIIRVLKSGHLAHLYWGKGIRNSNFENLLKMQERASFSPNVSGSDKALSLDTLPQEYPAYGNGDFRTPAFQLQLENGSTITDLRYQNHRIYSGKPKLEGLPATYAEQEDEAETLEIDLFDSLISLRVILSYTVFKNHNVVARSARLVNEGPQQFKLLRALSMSVDLPRCDYDLLQLQGAWARERYMERRPLAHGNQSIESRRGASGHQLNPFMALLSKNAGENYGEVYGFSLVYSGSFIAQVEVDQFDTARVSMGINPFDFTWKLEPGSSFQTPEAVMVYSDRGLGHMSREYHRLYRSRLCRGKHRDSSRPVLINNWEATYFDFNAEKILDIAREGANLGMELFVLDDGWFGKRDSDNCSLGDWFVDKRKLPDGLKDLASKVNQLGLKFGLWFEPEMISPDSDLYRAHPDWCLHVPGRKRTEARNQLVLDYSRKDVCDAIIKMVSDILSTAPVAYVKWDMNRNMTEIGSAVLPADRQRETAHRYILGLYRVMEEITSRFPDILFESCSGGGGRFDPGILYYMPQTWTSDDTDAVERLKIQHGTSIVYPAGTMGAHVSAVPNHQVGRSTPIETRGNAAMCGNFGYELDLTKLSEADKAAVREQVRTYKEIRHIIQFGDMYRLLSPFEGNETAWIFVTEDKSEAFLTFFRVLAQPHAPLSRIRLEGLDEARNYKLEGMDLIMGGDILMNFGLNVPELQGDYASFSLGLKAI
jgi:alpha-galactosidase